MDVNVLFLRELTQLAQPSSWMSWYNSQESGIYTTCWMMSSGGEIVKYHLSLNVAGSYFVMIRDNSVVNESNASIN